MKDSNGYSESILPTRAGRCYVCGKETDTARHEIFGGTANRKNSKAEGLWINVCPKCHTLIHALPNEEYDLHLKRNAQWMYECSHTRDEFIKLFGRNWL